MDKKGIVLDTVEMISQLMGELESHAFESEGFSEITLRQMLYLETIDFLGTPTFSELAEHLRVTLPSVSGIIKRLILLGYVQKQQSADDGRVYFLSLTEKGLRFNDLHDEVHKILAQRIIQNLSEGEISELAELLSKIT
ncbi:MAG: MarR family winged helix-turn-helix transcriptional regulator [Anaerolineales bacterium]|jgi:DNA-binding MarR family transcriptional regulator